MDQFNAAIEELSKVGFHSTKLRDLYSSHTIADLLDLLNYTSKNTDQLKKVLDYFDALFSDSTIYKELLLSENSFDFVQRLLGHENKKVRSLLSSCIENHDFEFGILISQLVQEKSKTLTLILQVIFFQLSDPASEVGLKALRVVKKLFNSADQYIKTLLSSELLVTYLNQGLNSKNEVVQLRYVEVLIFLTNLDETIQKAHINLFPIIFKLYNTNDILVKLNMIELIAGMGNSKWNAELMINQPFFKNIQNTAFTNNDDFYTQKYEVLLLVRMLSQRVLKTTPLIEKNVIKLLTAWLSTNSTEEIEGALEIISSYVKFTEGFNAVIKNTDFVGLFLKYLYSTKETIKSKASNAFISFFEQDQTSPKPPGKVVWLYSLFGNPLKAISQFQTNEQVCDATTYLIKQLNSPFGEVEKTMLDLLGALLEWEEIFLNIVANQSLLIYFSKISQNKEIFDKKNSIKNQIFRLCQEKYKAPEFQEYAQALKNLKLSKDMQYASDAA